MHDIFSFVACGVTTPRLIEECPDLLSLRPATQEIQVASIRTIPMYRYDKFEIFLFINAQLLLHLCQESNVKNFFHTQEKATNRLQ